LVYKSTCANLRLRKLVHETLLHQDVINFITTLLRIETAKNMLIPKALQGNVFFSHTQNQQTTKILSLKAINGYSRWL